MASSYKVSIYPHGIALIDFQGVLNPAVMGRAFQDCYSRKCYGLVIDLANTDNAPSSALELFSQASEMLGHLGGAMVFVNVDGPIQIILDMMGIPDKFPFFQTQQQALEHLMELRGTKRIQL